MPALSVLAHAALLVLLLRAPASPALMQGDPGPMAVSLIDGQMLAPQPRPTPPATRRATHQAIAKPPPPSDVEPQYVDVEPPEVDLVVERDPLQDPVAISVAASAAAGSACQVTAWLQQALQADPEVQAALHLVPRPARSVANAIMVWDAGWVAPKAQPAPGLMAIRMALVAGVRAAPPACRAELVRGPEMVVLSDGADTTVLAIGSGEWRWDDLLSPTLPQGIARVSEGAALSMS